MAKMTDKKEPRTKTTLYLPNALWKAAKIRAIELDCDATDIVVSALKQYVSKGGK